MPQGKGYVIVNHIPTLVHLLRRRTFDPSETPKLGMGSQEPALQTVDDATLRLLDDSLPVPAEPNVERLDRAALIERIQELTRTRAGDEAHQASAASSAQLEEAVAAEREKAVSLHKQLTAVREQVTQQEQEITRLHQEEHTTTRAHKELVATLRDTIARLEKECESLKGQLHLASQLTVSLTGLPSVEPLLANARSLSVEQAHVEQVSLGGGGAQKHTRTAKQVGKEQESTAVHRLQETLDALAQRITQLTQQDAEMVQLRRDLARFTHQQPASAPHVEAASPLRPREQRKLDRLIEMITHLPHVSFQCALLVLLLRHEGQELSYPEIAHHLHYELGTVRNRTTTALQKEGVIARAGSGTGYTSRFASYCDTRFPGVDYDVIRTSLVAALASHIEEQGA